MNETAGLRQVTKEEWIDALWSGKYRQGHGRLRDQETNRFCCLGVLADLAGVDWDAKPVTCLLSAKTCSTIGLDWLTKTLQHILAARNDEGQSFREIGEYLKELPH